MAWRNNSNKVGAKRVEWNGEVFDSKRELKRYQELLLLQKAGEISGLHKQVPYELIPNQYGPSTEVYARGIHKGEPKPGKLIERKVEYIADFVYTDNRSGELVVEDSKGFRDPSSAVYAKFVLKRKLMLWIHGIRIREV